MLFDRVDRAVRSNTGHIVVGRGSGWNQRRGERCRARRQRVRLYTESHTAKRIREILNPTNIVEEDEEDIDFTLFDDTYT
jgi:hypothetical protein